MIGIGIFGSMSPNLIIAPISGVALHCGIDVSKKQRKHNVIQISQARFNAFVDWMSGVNYLCRSASIHFAGRIDSGIRAGTLTLHAML